MGFTDGSIGKTHSENQQIIPVHEVLSYESSWQSEYEFVSRRFLRINNIRSWRGRNALAYIIRLDHRVKCVVSESGQWQVLEPVNGTNVKGRFFPYVSVLYSNCSAFPYREISDQTSSHRRNPSSPVHVALFDAGIQRGLTLPLAGLHRFLCSAKTLFHRIGGALLLRDKPVDLSFCFGSAGLNIAQGIGGSLSGSLGSIGAELRNTGLTQHQQIRYSTRHNEQASEPYKPAVKPKLLAIVFLLLFLVFLLLAFYFAEAGINEDGISWRRLSLAIMFYVVAHIPGYYILVLWGF